MTTSAIRPTITRRPKGSVRELEAGRRYELRYRSGGLPKSTVHRGTETEARRALDAILAGLATGARPVHTRHTLGSWLDAYTASVPETSLRVGTRLRYGVHVKRWQRDPIARVKLAELTTAHVAAALDRLERAGVAHVTQGQLLAFLRRALAAAIAEGHASRNVALLVKRGRHEPAVRMTPSAAELAALRPVLAADELAPLWTLALDTGLRLGELLALRWGDIHPTDQAASCEGEARPHLHVEGSVECHTLERMPPKTRAGRRVVPLSTAAQAALAGHRDALGMLALPGRLLFTDARNGGPLRHRYVLEHLHLACAAAGTRRFGVHALRHVFATRIVMAMPLVAAAKVLGHTDWKVTQRYVHLAPAAVPSWWEDAASG